MSFKTVGEVEELLFEAFAREDAEPWDRPGLAVGDRSAHAEKVAINLDMSVSAVAAAQEAGCNVLVSHHPAFIKDAPETFGPAAQAYASGPGSVVYEAARKGISTIAMHTNADRSIFTREIFAHMLECTCLGNCEALFDPTRSWQGTGFGALLEPVWTTQPTLELAADRCRTAFGGMPRVWGDANRVLGKIAFLNGSWRDPSVFSSLIAHGVDCAIVGESSYHVCLDVQPHLSVIELGHDKSELPIVDVLHNALISAGFDEREVVDLHCSNENWWPAV